MTGAINARTSGPRRGTTGAARVAGGVGTVGVRPGDPGAGPRRSGLAGWCFTLAALLLPVLLVAAWVDGFTERRDHYVQAMSALGDDDAVRDLVADRAAAQITASLRLDKAGAGALSVLAGRLNLPAQWRTQIEQHRRDVTRAAYSEVRALCDGAVRSPEFASLWSQATAQLYDQARAVARAGSDDEALAAAKAVVVRIDIAPLLTRVRPTLAFIGVPATAALPVVSVPLSAADPDAVTLLRDVFAAADKGAAILPGLCVALAAIGLVAAGRLSALGTACAWAVVPVGLLWVLADAATDAAAEATTGSGLTDGAIRAVAATATDLLRDSIRTALIGLVGAALAVFVLTIATRGMTSTSWMPPEVGKRTRGVPGGSGRRPAGSGRPVTSGQRGVASGSRPGAPGGRTTAARTVGVQRLR